MRKPKIGLLPLYLKLYDDVLASARGHLEEFFETIVSEIEFRGLDVLPSSVCRIKPEFQAAVSNFEEAIVDAIVTLHLAYSPSLESVDALAGTNLPVIILDTTPTCEFGPEQVPDEILYNHGIHGVQDLCNLLIRRSKDFHIEAGHWKESDVIDRVAAWARAAKAASSMRKAKIGCIGAPFNGMGDFQVSQAAFDTIGVTTMAADLTRLASLVPPEADRAVIAEVASDVARFNSASLDVVAHIRSVRASLAIREWIEQEKLTGWTMNFDVIDRSSGLPALPFLEASKGMARGIGYAGEGDALTAALVGALASVYPETTFTEMFCADWAGDRIFLSHMGEMNPALTLNPPELVEKPMPWIDMDPSVVLVGRFKGGKGVFVNLAPGPDNTFTLVLAGGEMDASGRENMPATVRGWFKPMMPVAEFLEGYSSVGGTHHAAFVYGDVLDDLAKFSELMGWDTVVLG